MSSSKKIICALVIIMMLVEIVIGGIAILAFTIPSIKISSGFRSTENGFDTINQAGYYALQNGSHPDNMAENYNETAVKGFCHTFADDFEPFIMFGYIPRTVDGMRIQCRIANENFFNLYSFSAYDGRLFETNDYVGDRNEAIPILVGYNLKEVYCLGEKYTFYHGDNGESFEGKVVGILQKGAVYSSLQEIRGSLDNSYIIPLSDYFIDNFFGLSDCDLIVSSAILNMSNTKLDSFIQECNEIGFWQLTAVPVTIALNDYETAYLRPLSKKIYLSVVVESGIVIFLVAEIVVFVKLMKNATSIKSRNTKKMTA